jgi:hypothetical protein
MTILLKKIKVSVIEMPHILAISFGGLLAGALGSLGPQPARQAGKHSKHHP